MPSDIKEIFRKVISELDQEEQNELLLELKNKKLTSSELVDAIRNLPPEERAAVREAFINVANEDGSSADKKEASKLEDDAEKEEEAKGLVDAGEKKVEDKKKKSRPGRKHGRAYGWYVDDKGRVKVSDVATVYSGEDEPDEVELYPDDEDEEKNDIEEDEDE